MGTVLQTTTGRTFKKNPVQSDTFKISEIVVN